MSRQIVRAAWLAAIAITVPTATIAGGGGERVPNGRDAAVRFGDLDLTTDAGEAALHQRVAAAARRVCATGERLTLATGAEMGRCHSAAIAQATPKIAVAVATARAGKQYADTSPTLSSAP